MSAKCVHAAVWGAMGKVAAKELVRESLEQGGVYGVNLVVSGDVDGEPYHRALLAALTVGHDATRSSSTTPDLKLLLAHVLGHLNQATRDKLLRDLPEQFLANGGALPAVDPVLEAEVGQMLERLRAKVLQEVRGALAVKYSLGV